MYRAAMLMMGILSLTGSVLGAQESSACDTRTDQYRALFRTGTKKEGLTLCAEYGEPDDEGDVPLRRLFAVRTIGGKDQVIKTMTPTAKDSSFGFWAGPYEQEAGQTARKIYMWFSAGASTYVAESCEGGRLCNPMFVGAVQIDLGKKTRESECVANPDDDWCQAMDPRVFFDENETTLKFKAKYPKLFSVKPVPPSVARLLK
jgi:hypothetical protein